MVGRSQHKNEMGPCGEDGHRQQHTQITHSTMGVRDETGGGCGGKNLELIQVQTTRSDYTIQE